LSTLWYGPYNSYVSNFNTLYFNQWNNYINQYLVGQPLLVITASILRGILSIKLIIWFIEILLHSSCKAVSNSVMFFITFGQFLILLPSSDHKCLIGFKSGDWLGHIDFVCKHSLLDILSSKERFLSWHIRKKFYFMQISSDCFGGNFYIGFFNKFFFDLLSRIFIVILNNSF